MRARSPRPALLLTTLFAVAALLLAACGGGKNDAGSGNGGASGGQEHTTLTVFAAASLTEAFNAIKPQFEAANQGVTVRYNFAGSQKLAGQIGEGAPADVFASADQRNMDKVVEAGQVGGAPAVFARTQLAVVVAKGNPDKVTGLADLARPGLKVVLAADEVPAGKYGRQALDKAEVTVKPVSLEEDVKSVVRKVALGEADAGIAYATDAKAAGDEVATVAIPADRNVTASYPVAVVKGRPHADAARRFADWLRGDQGQATLKGFGFLPAA